MDGLTDCSPPPPPPPPPPVTMAVVLVSPPTLYQPSATVIFHFVLKLIFSKIKKTLKNS